MSPNFEPMEPTEPEGADRWHHREQVIVKWADRILESQNVAQGSVAMARVHEYPNRVPALHVAAVLHALADHTMNVHMLQVAEERLMRRTGDSPYAPGVTSLGRWFHAVADEIEAQDGSWAATPEQTEWEYAWEADEATRAAMSPRGPRLFFDEQPNTPEAIAAFPRGRRVRRRKAGPWIPVEGGDH
jgi:hypothetical protein